MVPLGDTATYAWPQQEALGMFAALGGVRGDTLEMWLMQSLCCPPQHF